MQCRAGTQGGETHLAPRHQPLPALEPPALPSSPPGARRGTTTSQNACNRGVGRAWAGEPVRESAEGLGRGGYRVPSVGGARPSAGRLQEEDASGAETGTSRSRARCVRSRWCGRPIRGSTDSEGSGASFGTLAGAGCAHSHRRQPEPHRTFFWRGKGGDLPLRRTRRRWSVKKSTHKCNHLSDDLLYWRFVTRLLNYPGKLGWVEFYNQTAKNTCVTLLLE